MKYNKKKERGQPIRAWSDTSSIEVIFRHLARIVKENKEEVIYNLTVLLTFSTALNIVLFVWAIRLRDALILLSE